MEVYPLVMVVFHGGLYTGIKNQQTYGDLMGFTRPGKHFTVCELEAMAIEIVDFPMKSMVIFQFVM